MTSAESIERDRFVLLLSCPDQIGIVYAVGKFMVERRLNIVDSQQFGDARTGRFFMRVQFEAPDAGIEIGWLRWELTGLGAEFRMDWRVVAEADPQRVLLLVSKAGHCLNDLLFQARSGGLNMEVPAVVSNHTELGYLAQNYGIPFHHLPVAPATKAGAEQKLLHLIDSLDIDLVVLARYMQVLSPALCEALSGRVINIHHSMLPSFKGARPYVQAYDRGVKLVGATAHYVTSDLDEGPIIEQQVARVNHRMSAAQVTALGRDNEAIALRRAVRWHTEHRILLDGHRTVVFH